MRHQLDARDRRLLEVFVAAPEQTFAFLQNLAAGRALNPAPELAALAARILADHPTPARLREYFAAELRKEPTP